MNNALLLFLTFLNVLNFVDRQLIPSLAPKLIDDLHLTRADIGLLYGFAFLFFYTLMGMLFGPAADRGRRPRIIAGGLAVWSLMTFLSGAASNFAHLAWARMFVGVGEAVLTPAALSLLADRFPPERRAFASGFYYIGVPLGSGLSLIVSGWLAVAYGWRTCFFALGIVGILIAPLVFFIRETHREDVPAEGSGSFAEYWRVLGNSHALWLTLISSALLNWATTSTIHFTTWLAHDRHIPYQRVAYFCGALYTVAGVLGVSMGGWMSDRFHRRWSGGRLWFLVAATLAAAPFSILSLLLPFNETWYLAIWMVSMFGSVIWFGPIFAAVQDLTPLHLRSTSVAFALLVMNLLGNGPGAYVTGWIGDRAGLEAGLFFSAMVGWLAVLPLAAGARAYQAEARRVQQMTATYVSAPAEPAPSEP